MKARTTFTVDDLTGLSEVIRQFAAQIESNNLALLGIAEQVRRLTQAFAALLTAVRPPPTTKPGPRQLVQ